MKRRGVSILLTVMTIAASATTVSATSPSTTGPENPVIVDNGETGGEQLETQQPTTTTNTTGNNTTGNSTAGNNTDQQLEIRNPQAATEDGKQLVVQQPNTDAYSNQKVADTITWANNTETTTTVKGILERMEENTKQEFRTEDNKQINPTLFEQLTPFVDVAIQDGNQVEYQTNGSIKMTLTIDAAKDVKKKDVVLMQIDPTTGKISFVSVEKLDAKTGEITVTLSSLGPVALITKVPIVSKGTSPEKYSDEGTKAVVNEYEGKKANIPFKDLQNSMKEHMRR
jgi:hypothetical protein